MLFRGLPMHQDFHLSGPDGAGAPPPDADFVPYDPELMRAPDEERKVRRLPAAGGEEEAEEEEAVEEEGAEQCD